MNIKYCLEKQNDSISPQPKQTINQLRSLALLGKAAKTAEDKKKALAPYHPDTDTKVRTGMAG